MHTAKNKRPAQKILLYAILLLAAFPVWWVLWFMFNGALMPVDELKDTLGPVLAGTQGMAKWPLLVSWPTLQPLVELLLDTPQFFVMFWNSFKLSRNSIPLSNCKMPDLKWLLLTTCRTPT